MIRKALLCLGAIALLSGCSSKQQADEKTPSQLVVGTFKKVEVIKKQQIDHGKLNPEYIVTVGKNGQKVDLKSLSKDSYNVLHTGNIITVGYDKQYYIQTIKFDKLED